MKRLLFAAVFAATGFVMVNAQKTETKATVTQQSTTADSAVMKTLKGADEKTKEVSPFASVTAQTATTTSVTGAEKAAEVKATTPAVDAGVNANLNAQENANAKSAVAAQTEVKAEVSADKPNKEAKKSKK